MQIATRRFGTIEIDEGRIIAFPAGLIGLKDANRFVLLEQASDSPFHWLQSVDDPNLAFVVMDPLVILPDYRDAIPPQKLEDLGDARADQIVILTTVTIDGENQRVTTNLLGPLLVDPTTRKGKQVVLDGSPFSTKHDLLSGPAAHRDQAAGR